MTIVGPNAADTIADRVEIKAISRNGSSVKRMTRTVWTVYTGSVRQAADIYHFHDPELIPVGLLLRARGKQVIYDIHEDLPKDIMSKFYLPLVEPPGDRLVREQIRRRRVRTFLRARRRHALDCRTFSSAEPANRDRAQLPVPERNCVRAGTRAVGDPQQSVAYVGGITAQRAIREMVQAIALVPEPLGATLELAGNEIMPEAKPAEIYGLPGWQRVKHHGFLDQPSTFRLLHHVRAGLVLFHPEPNHVEAMPQKIFEYMGAALPLIASDFPFWREILGPVECALFVDPMKPQAIADAIEYILRHPQQAEAMGRRGQAAVLERYNWDTKR